MYIFAILFQCAVKHSFHSYLTLTPTMCLFIANSVRPFTNISNTCISNELSSVFRHSNVNTVDPARIPRVEGSEM